MYCLCNLLPVVHVTDTVGLNFSVASITVENYGQWLR